VVRAKGINEGSIITKHFKPEFRQEVAELVVDKGCSIRGAAEAMSVGKSTVDKWARDLRKERNGEKTQGAPISEERRKISALEREIQQLKMEKQKSVRTGTTKKNDLLKGAKPF
jgi:transposase